MHGWPVWLLFVHIAGAFWLAAGVFAGAVVRVQGRRASEPAARALAARLAWRLHVVHTLPGLVVTGLAGFYLVGLRGHRFGAPWVAWSMLLYLVLFLLSLFIVTPQLQRQAAGDGTAAPGARLAGVVSDVGALLIVVILFLMVHKPV